jgi:hypothetical protein
MLSDVLVDICLGERWSFGCMNESRYHYQLFYTVLIYHVYINNQ